MHVPSRDETKELEPGSVALKLQTKSTWFLITALIKIDFQRRTARFVPKVNGTAGPSYLSWLFRHHVKCKQNREEQSTQTCDKTVRNE